MKYLVLVVAATALTASAALATPKFAQKEKKPCLFCHTVPSGGERNLNDAGKWYRMKKTLAGFRPAPPKKPTPKPAPPRKPTPKPAPKKP